MPTKRPAAFIGLPSPLGRWEGMHGSTVGPPSMSDTKCTRPARVSVRTVTQKHALRFWAFGVYCDSQKREGLDGVKPSEASSKGSRSMLYHRTPPSRPPLDAATALAA